MFPQKIFELHGFGVPAGVSKKSGADEEPLPGVHKQILLPANSSDAGSYPVAFKFLRPAFIWLKTLANFIFNSLRIAGGVSHYQPISCWW